VLFSFHPTKRALILSAAFLLESKSVAEITSELVLEHSGISKGSLYHHFQEFEELMTYAQIFMFSTYVDSTISTVLALMDSVKSREDVLKNSKEVSRLTQSPSLSRMRNVRMESISKSISSEKLHLLLGQEQARLNQALADLFRHLQDKGWGAMDLDPRVVAVFWQAYTLGKVVDDLSLTPTTEENWNQIIDEMFEKIFFPKVQAPGPNAGGMG
jgi:AcrR family transcriptional regulator